MNPETDTPESVPTQAAGTTPASAIPQAEPAPVEAVAAERSAVFPAAQGLVADPASMRDDLSKVQTNATEAARLSGDHFSRLLYGPDADLHMSPYGVPPTPNALDSRKP